MQIYNTKHKEIEKSNWDNTIRKAPNGNLYGFSWYLDAVCPGWNALISSDYKHIMPLTRKAKFGINYLFRPLLSQQLGLFSMSPINTNDVDSFLKAIPAKYKLVQICLNSSNKPSDRFKIIPHNTYLLDLKPDYDSIRKGFSENHRRNIKKSLAQGLQIIEGLDKDHFINLLLNDSSPGGKILAEKRNLKLFKTLINSMENNKALKIIGAKNPDGKTIAAVLFGFSHKTWIYLAPVNSEEGKGKRALFSIINHLIKNRSGRDEILDFEGSDIKGLAQFYSGFGANKMIYNEFQVNSLPWPIKYLK